MSTTAVMNEIAFQRILLATDFSETATVAISYATALARRYSSTLELANVLDLATTAPAMDVIVPGSLETIRHTLEIKLDEVARGIRRIQTRTKVIEGFDSASLLIDEAVNVNADLIVMGTSSKHGLNRLALGSVAEKVTRESPCPVLTIGPHVLNTLEGELRFRRIIYAMDFSERASRAAHIALPLASGDGAKLYLCHVIDRQESARGYPDEISLNALKALVSESFGDCKPECIVEHGKVAPAILALAGRVGADLIVLGSRRSSFWLDYVTSGLTPAILAEATCPVLTVC